MINIRIDDLGQLNFELGNKFIKMENYQGGSVCRISIPKSVFIRLFDRKVMGEFILVLSDKKFDETKPSDITKKDWRKIIHKQKRSLIFEHKKGRRE